MENGKTKSDQQIEGTLNELKHAIKSQNKTLDEYTQNKDKRLQENKNTRDLLATFEGRAVIIWLMDQSKIDHRRNIESAIRQLYMEKKIRAEWLWGDLITI
ncbi:MAG: hypothetical protein V3W14_10150, partial [Candidatus Neomarinimicrobiota bacterium]